MTHFNSFMLDKTGNSFPFSVFNSQPRFHSRSRELKNSYEIGYDLPGVDPSTIEIKVEERELSVKCDRNKIGESVGFIKSYLLPEDVNVDLITAASNNGLLTITIPKPTKVAAKRIPVTFK